jgi:Cobalamin-independent synthase, Catalytic domain
MSVKPGNRLLMTTLYDVSKALHCRVEYFGQKLEGFAFTVGGWVQSYGSRYGAFP